QHLVEARRGAPELGGRAEVEIDAAEAWDREDVAAQNVGADDDTEVGSHRLDPRAAGRRVESGHRKVRDARTRPRRQAGHLATLLEAESFSRAPERCPKEARQSFVPVRVPEQPGE